jgi:N-acetylmuramic acid 6-phosphate etherase
MDLHTLDVEGCIDRITTEDRHAFDAVKRAKARITALVKAMEPGFLKGGRIIYVGAGTSGRLGVLMLRKFPPRSNSRPGASWA